MSAHVFCHRFLYGCGNKEILLFQAQLFSCIMVIVRIKHFHDIAGKVLLLHRFLVVPLIEGFQLKAFHRLRIPDAQCIYNAVSIADDRQIIWNRRYALIAFLPEIVPAVFIHIYIHIAAEFYFLGVFRPSQFKGIAVLQPVIGNLYLVSIPDLLLKHAVTVTDAAAIRGITQCSQGIQETCCKSSKASVSESRIRLLVFHHVQIHTKLVQRFFHRLKCLKVNNVIPKSAPHQKLHRQIINHFGILLFILFLARHPVVNNRILDRIGNCLKNLLRGSLFHTLSVQCLYIIDYAPLK